MKMKSRSGINMSASKGIAGELLQSLMNSATKDSVPADLHASSTKQ